MQSPRRCDGTRLEMLQFYVYGDFAVYGEFNPLSYAVLPPRRGAAGTRGKTIYPRSSVKVEWLVKSFVVMFKVTTSRQRTKAVFGATHFVDLGPDKRTITIEERSLCVHGHGLYATGFVFPQTQYSRRPRSPTHASVSYRRWCGKIAVVLFFCFFFRSMVDFFARRRAINIYDSAYGLMMTSDSVSSFSGWPGKAIFIAYCNRNRARLYGLVEK